MTGAQQLCTTSAAANNLQNTFLAQDGYIFGLFKVLLVFQMPA